MCGIIGYIGNKNASEIVIAGLTALEYRGYDSSGIAAIPAADFENKIILEKEKGELLNLKNVIEKNPIVSNLAIGHTRWATHGEPLKKNAHPHLSFDKKIAIVHNGIIENFSELKKNLTEKHHITFQSDTDSEIIAHLIALHYKGDLLTAVRKAVLQLKGAYSFSVISSEEKDRLVAVRKNAPLIVGVTKDIGNFIASDIPALLKYTRDFYFIENDEIVDIKKDSVDIYDEAGVKIERELEHINWSVTAAEKGGYKHFMLKEIFEQPTGVHETLGRRLDAEKNIKLDDIKITERFIRNIDKIYIVACGTAYHAGKLGKYIIEKLTRIPVEVEVASEFRYRDPVATKKTLFIAISQSGETLDTLESLREAKRKGARVLSIVNVIGSSVARESDDVFYTWAGPEIAVASTKAYTTQLISMYLIALFFAKKIKKISEHEYFDIINELESLPEKIEEVLKKENAIKKIAEKVQSKEHLFFIGRGPDTVSSYEASLKLKEISYINSFAIEAGELKHGTIALIDENSIVFAIATQGHLLEKVLSNAEEIMARKGKVFPLVQTKSKKLAKLLNEDIIEIPNVSDIVAPILSIVPLQLLAYHIADLKGMPIDKPKNLAKSVTVE